MKFGFHGNHNTKNTLNKNRKGEKIMSQSDAAKVQNAWVKKEMRERNTGVVENWRDDTEEDMRSDAAKVQDKQVLKEMRERNMKKS